MNKKLLLASSVLPMLLLFALPGVASAESTYAWQGYTYTETINGTDIGQSTGVMWAHTRPNGTNEWYDRIQIWGRSANVNSYLNEPNSATGIDQVTFTFRGNPSTGTNIIIQGANPQNVGSNTLVSSIEWAVSGIPGAGAIFAAIANAVNVGVTTTQNANDQWTTVWSNPSNTYNLPSSVSYTKAVNGSTTYNSYSDRYYYYAPTTSSGVIDDGAMQYQTGWEDNFYPYGDGSIQQYTNDANLP